MRNSFFLFLTCVYFAVATQYMAPVPQGTGDCSSAANACSSLVSAIQRAQTTDTITIAAGNYTTSMVTIANGQNLNIVGASVTTVTFNLMGSYINATGATVQLSIQGITFMNGSGVNGGAFLIQGVAMFSLTKVIVLGCAATNYGGGVYISNAAAVSFTQINIAENNASTGGGLAIFNSNNIMFLATIIELNNADYDAGFIIYGCTGVNIVNSTIEYNQANTECGGGVVQNSDLTITGTLILANIAGKAGGICLYNTSTVVFNSGFINYNTAAIDIAGGVNIDSPEGSITFNTVTFYQNQASDDGGAVAIAYSTSLAANPTVTFTGCIFNGNSGYDGGAIYSASVPVIMSGSQIINTVSSDSGAIYLSFAYVSMSSTQVNNNTASVGCTGDLFCETACGNTNINELCSGVSFSNAFQCCACGVNSCPCKTSCPSAASGLVAPFFVIVLAAVIRALL